MRATHRCYIAACVWTVLSVREQGNKDLASATFSRGEKREIFIPSPCLRHALALININYARLEARVLEEVSHPFQIVSSA